MQPVTDGGHPVQRHGLHRATRTDRFARHAVHDATGFVLRDGRGAGVTQLQQTVGAVGTHAGDLIAEYVLAMKQGIGLNRILGTIHIYPTLAEANKYVAGEWRRAHAPQRLLQWVARYHAWERS